MALGTPTNLTSGGNAVASSSDTTASISPTAECLIIASVGINRSSGVPTAITVTDSFAGAIGPWTMILIRGSLGKACICLAYAVAGRSPGAGTITFTYSGGTGDPVRKAWIVDYVTGANIANPVKQNGTANVATSTMVITLAALTANNKAYGAIDNMAGTAITPGTNETEILEVSSTGAQNVELQTEYGQDATVDWSTLVTSNESVGIAIEIIEALPVMLNNYEFVRVGAGMSVSERVK